MRLQMLRLGGTLGRGFVVVAVVFVALLIVCAFAFYAVERTDSGQTRTLADGFLWVTRTLLQGEPPWDPRTGVGHFLFYVVVIAGVGLVAMATGAIATKMIELLMRKDAGMGSTDYSGHIVICGWSAQGTEILRELHAERVADPQPVVILASLETNPTSDPLAMFVRGSPSDAEDLTRAGIARASTAIVLADQSSPAAAPDDVDGKTLLTALAVESLNPDVYTCVEVIRSQNRQHFQRTNADELVVSAELTGSLLAISAMNHGMSRVIADLTSHGDGQELYQVPVPRAVAGRPFSEVLVTLKAAAGCLAIGVRAVGADIELNPPNDSIVGLGGLLLVMAAGDPAERLEALR